MNEVHRIKFRESYISPNWLKTPNWITCLVTGNWSKYRLAKNLRRIEYWWIEIDLIDNTIKRKIGFDFFKQPIIGLGDINLLFDVQNIEVIDPIDINLFNDVWSIYEKRNLDLLMQMHSKYFDLWRYPKMMEAPLFPCYILDLRNVKEIIEVDNFEEFIKQPDLTGYEWTDSQRLIDSRGNVYLTDYINFGHPVGVVIPLKIERKIEVSKMTEYLRTYQMN